MTSEDKNVIIYIIGLCLFDIWNKGRGDFMEEKSVFKIVLKVIGWVLILIALYFTVCLINNQNPLYFGEENTDENGIIYITNEDNIKSIHIKNEKGEYDIDREAVGDGYKYLVRQHKENDSEAQYIEEEYKKLCKIMARRKIERKRLNENYGFDGSIVCTLYRDDGSEIKIFGGVMTNMDGEYYCKKEGDDTLYAIGTSEFTALNKGQNEFRSTEIFNISKAADVSELSLYSENNLELKIRNKTKTEQVSSATNTPWVMVMPYKVELDENNAPMVVEKLIKINVLGFSNDTNIFFDHKVEFTANGKKYSLETGSKDGLAYVKNDENGIIYNVRKDYLITLEKIRVKDIISKKILPDDINNIKEIKTSCGRLQYDMTRRQGDGETICNINTRKVEDEEYRYSYDVISQLEIVGMLDEVINEEPHMTIAVTYKSGNVITYKIYAADAMYCKMVLPTGQAVVVSKSAVDAIENLR